MPKNTSQLNLSESNLKASCPHCDHSSFAFAHPLEMTDNFYVICDAHAITEGHILIIPKAHTSCVGEYNAALFDEFLALNDKVTGFVQSVYGSASAFEHGKFGQSIFHSHVHYVPFAGRPEDIIPEGFDRLRPLKNLAELRGIFQRDGGYLFLAIGNHKWTVDPSLTAPRFFRDRFAMALGVPERGDWKAMREDPATLRAVSNMNQATKRQWQAYTKRLNDRED